MFNPIEPVLYSAFCQKVSFESAVSAAIGLLSLPCRPTCRWGVRDLCYPDSQGLCLFSHPTVVLGP
jgi:hypothetical protein